MLMAVGSMTTTLILHPQLVTLPSCPRLNLMLRAFKFWDYYAHGRGQHDHNLNFTPTTCDLTLLPALKLKRTQQQRRRLLEYSHGRGQHDHNLNLTPTICGFARVPALEFECTQQQRRRHLEYAHGRGRHDHNLNFTPTICGLTRVPAIKLKRTQQQRRRLLN
jgi:hypothetical protein